jgi:hypothetical protein
MALNNVVINNKIMNLHIPNITLTMKIMCDTRFTRQRRIMPNITPWRSDMV